MLDGLRRWLGGDPGRSPELAALARWAQAEGWAFKPVKDGAGGVVEAGASAAAWRAEWGLAQRGYIDGPELRLIAEPAAGARELQMLVINRDLAESLEHALFEQAVGDVRTRLDAESPPEARWLVLHPKLEGAKMGELRLRYVAAGSSIEVVQQWLAPPLGEALARTLPQVASTEPVVLSYGRGRLTLRTALTMPTLERLALWREVFVAAIERLPAAVQAWRDADRHTGPDINPSTLGAGHEDTI